MELRFRPIASAGRMPAAQKVATSATSRFGQRFEAFALASALAAVASRISTGFSSRIDCGAV